jgi:t-SNARE complex subunit (syntaxin)
MKQLFVLNKHKQYNFLSYHFQIYTRGIARARARKKQARILVLKETIGFIVVVVVVVVVFKTDV